MELEHISILTEREGEVVYTAQCTQLCTKQLSQRYVNTCSPSAKGHILQLEE